MKEKESDEDAGFNEIPIISDDLIREIKSRESDHSDQDTGFIDPSSLGSGGEEENGKPSPVLPDPRPQDESYETIDFIEVSYLHPVVNLVYIITNQVKLHVSIMGNLLLGYVSFG